MFAVILIAPVIQLIFLGYAATLDVNIVHTLVCDQDQTIESRKFIESFTSSRFFKIDYYADDYTQLTKNLDKGNIILALIIPKDFSKKIQRRETSPVQAIFNGSDGNTASIVAGYVAKIVQDYSQNILVNSMDKMGRKILPVGRIEPEIRVWYNRSEERRVGKECRSRWSPYP